MSNFSYVKALEAEVADLKAEMVELSAKIPAKADEASGERTNPSAGSETLVAAFTAGAIGLIAGYALAARGNLMRF